MFKEEGKDQASCGSWRTFTKSASWTERPPRKSSSKPQWNSKARACLPPLQPLSIIRPSIDEWPKAGCDDLGIWPNPPTPGTRSGSVTPRENSTSDQQLREFDCRKDKLAFFNKECSRILNHIYLGSDAIAKDREVLRQNGITHVLNCVGFVCPEYFKDELVYKTLWLQDCPSEDITSILYDVFDYFEEVREQSGRVLVHCCQGVSRSTSLVIAYLMWKEGQSFDDAFQHVKAARGITNPNVGFACQLLQCQKRVHALPVSPTSLLRVYRMAPHSPYDPLHLVPKLLCEPSPYKLDSRGAFIIHVPSILYVWIGKHCAPVMSDNAMAAASQVVCYERAQGPVVTIREGQETAEFWDALNYRKHLANGSDVGRRQVDEYDLDFEVFHSALAGGVVPPFPLSKSASETCLPARGNGWDKLRGKITRDIAKEIISCAKLGSNSLQMCGEQEIMNRCNETEDALSLDELSMPSSIQVDSADSLVSYITCRSLGWGRETLKEVGFPDSPPDTSLSDSPSFNLVDSFSALFVSKPKPDSISTSPSISPSASDHPSLFTFSRSSSNRSDFSCVSQTSPCRLESVEIDPCNSGYLVENSGFVDEGTYGIGNIMLPLPDEAINTCHFLRAAGSCLTTGEIHSVFRGSGLPPRMMLPSIDEMSLISDSVSGDVVPKVDCKNREASVEMDEENSNPDASICFEHDGVLSRLRS